MYPTHPLILVEWEDHSGEAGWVDDPAKSKHVTVKTIGWLVFEDAKKIVVHDSLTDDDGSGGENVILKCCVKERYEIEIQ